MTVLAWSSSAGHKLLLPGKMIQQLPLGLSPGRVLQGTKGAEPLDTLGLEIKQSRHP